MSMENVHPFQSRETVRAEARAWVLKFNADAPPGDADIAALQEWARRSPLHRAELERAQQFWCDADMLSELAVPARRNSGLSDFARRFTVAVARSRRLGAIAALLVLGVAFGLLYEFPGSSGTVGNGDYRTATGELRTVTLTDASQILLDTDSEVLVTYNDARREIQLLRGKAYFAVAKEAGRPFEVYAGGGMVRAVGTAFAVDLGSQEVKVTVEEGRVDVYRIKQPGSDTPRDGTMRTGTSAHTAAGTVLGAQDNQPLEVIMSVDAGHRAVFSQETESIVTLAENELSRELSWRRGLLIFTGDSLGHVVSEVNRYSRTKIEIVDPELNNLKVGGRFRVGELDALLDVLGAGFGVQISYLDRDRILLRSAAAR